jgi:ketohexokinase
VPNTSNQHSVPAFPEPDTKIRAENVKKRRGGNVGNTLQVLSDILEFSAPDPSLDVETKLPRTTLYLLAPLPEKTSADGALIAASLPNVDLLNTSSEKCESAPASMIIQTKNGPTQGVSRTIISHPGALPEMTVADFKAKIPLWNDYQNGDAVSHPPKTRWVHFEGRNPITTRDCIAHLRNTKLDVHISIECEHPERKLLVKSAQLADVVFFSKLWAEVKTNLAETMQGKSLFN